MKRPLFGPGAALIVGWLLSCAPVWAAPGQEDDPFANPNTPPAQPFETVILSAPDSAVAGEEITLRYRLSIPDEHWVYWERTGLEVLPSPGYEVVALHAPDPEIKFDPFLEKEVEVYKHDTEFVASLRAGWSTSVSAVLRYQGCNNSFCFFPQADTLRVELRVVGSREPVAAADGALAAAAASGDEASQRLLAAAERGFVWLLLLAFGAGFATSLTPCVYPMIPITIGIIGARSAGKRSKGFSLSLLYVLGIAFTYSALGTTAALTGSLFGGVLQNAWVVGFVCLVFLLMAMSMFGAFELQVPALVSGRMSRVQGSGYPGAFLLGLVAGIVASPCIGPVLVAMLAYVGATGDAFLGFSLFFTFALGLGVLFVVLGTFTGLIAGIPKSGSWMIGVKTIFGLVFLGVALFYLHPLLPQGRTLLIAGVVLLIVGLLLRGWRLIDEAEPTARRWSKAFGRAALVGGLYAVSVPLILAGPAGAPAGPPWLVSEADGMHVAVAEGKPLLVDFSAEWCVACKELEHFTFSDERVIELAKSFVTVRVDATHQTPEIQGLIHKYGIRGLPWVAFVTPDGTILKHLTVTGFIDADAMLERMQEALKGTPTRAASF
jgi:thiol:disulfide interchange protein DsbD